MRGTEKSILLKVAVFLMACALLAGCGKTGTSRQESVKETAAGEMAGEESVTAEPVEQGTTAKETEPDTTAKETKPESTVKETELKFTAEESKQEPESAMQEMTATEEQQPETYEDNFAVDEKAVKAFAEKVKKATAEKNLEALAELTAFPVYVGLPDVGVVETKEAFLALGAKAVFTDELVRSVEMADLEDMQPCMAGFSISDGGTENINFGVVDGILAINGINY